VDAATRRQLLDGAAALGVPLDEPTAERLLKLAALLQTWAARINLTAITNTAEVVDKHLLDSLAVARVLDRLEGDRLIDVGSGAGFPGLVVAIARPNWRVTSVEPTHKKTAFQLTAKATLAIPIEIRTERDNAVREQFDVAVSRATFDPAEWVARGERLVRPGGALLAMFAGAQPPEKHLADRFAYQIAGAPRTIGIYRMEP
jgi:16S rRNA (guanine527-N7)-methyltransferase